MAKAGRPKAETKKTFKTIGVTSELLDKFDRISVQVQAKRGQIYKRPELLELALDALAEREGVEL